MPLPPSVTRSLRNGDVKFTSNVDQAQYTLEELTRAALRDIGKFVNYETRKETNKRAGGGLRKTKRPRNSFQHWVRKRETDLIVGIKHDTWYGVDQELGLNGQPKRDILRKTVLGNVNVIIKIQAQYLKHMESVAEAVRNIDENSEGDNGD